MIPLLLSPEAVVAATWVILCYPGIVIFVTRVQMDQQNISTMQKYFYDIKLYFNFLLTESIFEANAVLNINEICIV